MSCITCKNCIGLRKIDNQHYEVECAKCNKRFILDKYEIMTKCDDWGALERRVIE